MIQRIKTELISSCINNDPDSFLPFLMSAEVVTEAPNKEDFYQFFKGMLNHAHESSDGELLLKIEQSTLDTDKQVLNYNFYDNTHKFPLLSIVVKENNNLIYLGVMPF
ncbi:hypothetical protein [Flavobacterium sp. I-STPA6A]|uniref:hypothetical protein n=1 Tax=Flavobacterium sp. I-STPA6A TaxID=2590450 RepID=UPI00131EBCB4|nr:hypothetical protein [Flavobacterium sp. I-STPA6A]